MFTGLTAKKSATIPVCLAEIDRSRAQSPHDWEFATDRVTQLVNVWCNWPETAHLENTLY
jgi:hypothetical protein